MTIKYIPKSEAETFQLSELEAGEAFRFDDQTFVRTDENDADSAALCVKVSGDNPGYLAHFYPEIAVERVSLTITED